jgi:hypothetical protein
MIQFTIQNKPKISFSLDNKVEITFVTEKQNLKQLQALEDKEYDVEIKKHRNKRSLSQNAYLWVLLDEIGKKIQMSKEEVYKKYIKDYGVFEIVPIKNEAVDRFVNAWQKNGVGWVCQSLGMSKAKGFTNIITYYGSSSYDSKEMTRILEAVIMDCEEMDIDTMPLKDILLLGDDNDVR